ncbi:MAG: hypothetical protein MK110_00455 [Fuerstiella sp.]|nr:hypothetical protein [Fuerstiella sp.]
MKISETKESWFLVVFFTVFVFGLAVADLAAAASDSSDDWLLFSAKGERAPDGSASAPVVGIIRANGSAEQYPDFGVPGQKGWQLGPQFSDGKFVARSFENTTMSPAGATVLSGCSTPSPAGLNVSCLPISTVETVISLLIWCCLADGCWSA